ncbi:class I SAM-dependent methyltransferase [Brachymonas sp. M4Q-1]|uniref:class I SAM-dependent methyltransferase n=1 Tax=Brachymonas sp. M4Q-1 TaxID=3416906 RepID=UPI003CEE35D9
MSFDIPRAIFHEVFTADQLPRTPETDLVMDAAATVEDYSSSGEEGGALFGLYLYNALQVSARLKLEDSVIDLGCGSGRLLNLIAQWNPRMKFTGVDLAPNMLSKAREQAVHRSLSNVSYSEGDFSTLSRIDDHSADAVISSMAIHHLPDRESLARCFSAIKRVLKPGGTLYLMDFGRLRSLQAIEIFVAKVGKTEAASVTQDYRASLLAAYTPEDFSSEIARTGLHGVSLHRTIIAPLVMIASTALPARGIEPSLLARYRDAVKNLSASRQIELQQMRRFLQAGGMGFPT